MNPMREFETVHRPRHADIGEENVNFIRSRLTNVQSGNRVPRLNRDQTALAQSFDGEHAQERFVFGNHDDYRAAKGFRRVGHPGEARPSSKLDFPHFTLRVRESLRVVPGGALALTRYRS